jgi:hypothetical protein
MKQKVKNSIKVEELKNLQNYINQRLDLHNDWWGKINIKEMFGSIDNVIEKLENYYQLQSEVHKDIERVWIYDSSFPLNEVNMEERAKLIEKVFYKVAQEWILVDNQEPLF